MCGPSEHASRLGRYGLGWKEPAAGDFEGDDLQYWANRPSTNQFRQLGGLLDFQVRQVVADCGVDQFFQLAEMKASENERYVKLESDLVSHFGYLVQRGQHHNWLRS